MAALVLAGMAPAGAGCGRRLIGHLPSDGGVPIPQSGDGPLADRVDPGDTGAGSGGLGGGGAGGVAGAAGDGGPADTAPPVPGQVVWAVPGQVASDGTGTFYTTVREGNDAAFWRIDDKMTGALGWHDDGTLFCFSGNVVVLKSMFLPGWLAGISPDTGAETWSLDTAAGQASCVPDADRLVLLGTGLDSASELATRRASDGTPVWAVPLPEPSALIEHTDGDTIYVSTTIVGSHTTLTSLRLADGQQRWSVALPSGDYRLRFLFDGQGGVYVVEDNVDTATVSRLSASNGAPMWTYPPASAPAVYVTPVVDGSTTFILVQEQQDLVAVDKLTGAVLWRYPANPNGFSATWDARFMKTGDVLVSGHTALPIDYTGSYAHTTVHAIVSPAGTERWKLDPAGEVIEGSSAPRYYLWEPRAGELYNTEYGLLVRVDPATGNQLWPAWIGSVDRVIGSDQDLVIVAGPPQGCCFLDEWVQAVSVLDGLQRWQMSRQFTGPITVFGEDNQRLYLQAAPDSMYTPGTTVAVWK